MLVKLAEWPITCQVKQVHSFSFMLIISVLSVISD